MSVGKFIVMMVILAGLSVGIMFLLPDLNRISGHAIDRHGSAASIVQKCIDNGGSVQIWFNSDTNRKATICKIEEGKFGVKIHEILENGMEDPVTSFIKEKLKSLEQVMRYMRNRGYSCVTGC